MGTYNDTTKPDEIGIIDNPNGNLLYKVKPTQFVFRSPDPAMVLVLHARPDLCFV